MMNFYSKRIYFISSLAVLFTYYQNTGLTGSWNTYYGYISSNVAVSSQSQCETSCLNNAACKLYQFWSLTCNLFAYQSGVTSVSSSLLGSYFNTYSGCITASRN
jgi:hypothetical protein